MGRIRIFYLDDEEELLAIFQETFESDRHEIRTFSSPNDLILEVAKNPPSLIFLDYRLPSTTGLEVAKLLPDSIPKILITGDLNISGASGFQEILTKPFSISEIQKILDQL